MTTTTSTQLDNNNDNDINDNNGNDNDNDGAQDVYVSRAPFIVVVSDDHRYGKPTGLPGMGLAGVGTGRCGYGGLYLDPHQTCTHEPGPAGLELTNFIFG